MLLFDFKFSVSYPKITEKSKIHIKFKEKCVLNKNEKTTTLQTKINEISDVCRCFSKKESAQLHV